MREFLEIAKACSDPNRVRILLALKGHELCVCQLVELVGLATSTVSKHMSILRQAYLVDNRKEGRWAYYRRVGKEGRPCAQEALRWLDRSTRDEWAESADKDRLKKILDIPVEELCKTGNDD